MPTYEYKCDACGFAFEKFQSMTAPPVRKCPKCGKLKVKRLISAGAGLIFKGGGFYITDYRSDAYKKSASSDAPAAPAKADSTAAGKSGDSTPAAGGADNKTKSEPKPAQPSAQPSSKPQPAPAKPQKSKKTGGDS